MDCFHSGSLDIKLNWVGKVNFLNLIYSFCKIYLKLFIEYVVLYLFCQLTWNVNSQGLSFLLAMVLKALGPHEDRCYDSDEEYDTSRRPLLKTTADPPHVVDPLYMPRK